MDYETVSGPRHMREQVNIALDVESAMWKHVELAVQKRVQELREAARGKRSIGTLDLMSQAANCDIRADEDEGMLIFIREALEHRGRTLEGEITANIPQGKESNNVPADSGTGQGVAVGGPRNDVQHPVAQQRNRSTVAGRWVQSTMPHVREA